MAKFDANKFGVAVRVLNIISIAGMLVFFAVHAVLGFFQLVGIGDTVTRVFGWISMGFVSLHVVIGLYLTIKSLHARRMAGAGYFKENALFWARRLSGIAILIMLVFHLLVFSSSNAEHFRLAVFNAGRLVTQILLVIAIAIHVISNVRPMLMSFGVTKWKPYAGEIIAIISAVLILAMVGFIVYFMRWQQI